MREQQLVRAQELVVARQRFERQQERLLTAKDKRSANGQEDEDDDDDELDDELDDASDADDNDDEEDAGDDEDEEADEAAAIEPIVQEYENEEEDTVTTVITLPFDEEQDAELRKYERALAAAGGPLPKPVQPEPAATTPAKKKKKKSGRRPAGVVPGANTKRAKANRGRKREPPSK